MIEARFTTDALSDGRRDRLRITPRVERRR